MDEDFPSFSEDERRKVSLKLDRIYEHSRLRVFYTTYDLRQAADTIDLSERRDVLTPAYYDEYTTMRHPFWYARVLGIYHANVSYDMDQNTKRMEFLWVRWFAWDSTKPGGWETCQLDRVAYDNNDHQFGFLDPAAVVRAAHLIPAWAHGRTRDYFPQSSMIDKDGDFIYHYVNRWAFSSRQQQPFSCRDRQGSPIGICTCDTMEEGSVTVGVLVQHPQYLSRYQYLEDLPL